MNLKKIGLGIVVACTQTLAFAADTTPSAKWPSSPITVMVPGGPGTFPDLIGRIVGAKITALTGQSMIMEAKPAAGGIIAVQALLNKPSDGYTWLLGPNAMLAITPNINPNLPYDLDRDLIPITLLGSSSSVVVVNAQLPINSMAELIAYARQNPGKLNFASAGTGTPAHLGGEMLNQLANVKITHIPYKNSAAALTDVAGGQVDIMITSSITAAPFVRNGKVRLLASTGTTREAQTPTLPTVGETLKDYQLTQWVSIVTRSNTPPAVVERIHSLLVTALGDPKVVSDLASNGVTAKSMPINEFKAFLTNERAFYRNIVRDAGLVAK